MENKYCYTKVMILGSGKLAFQCAMEAQKYVEQTEVLEYKITDSTILQKMCQKENIPYFFCEKQELSARLREEKEKTLVISAGNTYLIPKDIIAKDNLTIINWHNALLPRHKGRNAEAWSIYEGDTLTGITWHRIVEAVDAGDIIVQKEIPISDTTTALGLFRKQCDLGAEVFAEIAESLLTDSCIFRKQEQGEEQIHFSYEVPGDGYLDVQWSYEKISCFLRAMDYGALQLLGEMHVRWQDKNYRFHKYKITQATEEAEAVWLQEKELIICKDGHKIVLKGLEQAE